MKVHEHRNDKDRVVERGVERFCYFDEKRQLRKMMKRRVYLGRYQNKTEEPAVALQPAPR